MHRPTVMIAVPNSGAIHPLVVARVIQLVQDHRFIVMYYPAKPLRPMDRSRATIAHNFLATEAEFLVMIDSDNPPMNRVLDLIEHDKPVIGCPTPAYDYRVDDLPPIFWNAWNVTLEGYGKFLQPEERVGLMPIHFVGLGCVVIRRDVIEKLGVGAFAGSFDEHGVSNDDDDDQFCKRCQAAGFSVWVHWDYCCRHIRGDVDLYDVMQCMGHVPEPKRSITSEVFGKQEIESDPRYRPDRSALDVTNPLPPPKCNVPGCGIDVPHTTREHGEAAVVAVDILKETAAPVQKQTGDFNRPKGHP